ncbi:MAG: TRM11 family SAM-dependent methyltransferase [Patescibacteria group bacterium]
MATHCFILGNNPVLSVAEFFRVRRRFGDPGTIIDITSSVIILENDSRASEEWQRLLGGIIKVGRIVSTTDTEAELIGLLTPAFLRSELLAQEEQKVQFGFSLYGQLSQRRREFSALGIQLKKMLAGDGLSVRFIDAPEGALSSVQVTKNSVIERGADILVIRGGHRLYLGVTEAVQDFERYSQRDYDRPKRDAVSGMLPPKLAQIMINLAGITPDKHLLDPFCGSGTILQESLLLGYRHITGSDISATATAASQANITWLHEHFPDLAGTVQLCTSDVSRLTEVIPVNSIDAIVTEPYLGPPIRREPEVIQMLTTIQELESLYLSAFRSFAQILKYEGTVAIVFPLFNTRHGIYSLKILETLQAMGFVRDNPIPDSVSLFAKIGPTARGSLVYRREGQTVERELFVFTFKKTEAV